MKTKAKTTPKPTRKAKGTTPTTADSIMAKAAARAYIASPIIKELAKLPEGARAAAVAMHFRDGLKAIIRHREGRKARPASLSATLMEWGNIEALAHEADAALAKGDTGKAMSAIAYIARAKDRLAKALANRQIPKHKIGMTYRPDHAQEVAEHFKAAYRRRRGGEGNAWYHRAIAAAVANDWGKEASLKRKYPISAFRPRKVKAKTKTTN